MAKSVKKEDIQDINYAEIEKNLKEALEIELKEYVDDKINKSFSEEIEKTNKKIIREKNKRIFFKNLYILILLAIIAYLVYLLYKNNFFNNLLEKNNTVTEDNTNIIVNDEPKENTTKEEKPSLDELKKKYSYLIDKIYINEESEYISDYYKGNLTNEIKNYITINNIDLNKLTTEEDYNIIDENLFKEKYDSLFEDYKSINFIYNGNKIRYIKPLNSYMTDSIIKISKSNIAREITKIDVNNDIVEITIIEGLIKDKKLYNILNKEEIETYNGDNILNYEDKLSKVTYVFKNNKLISLK